MDGTKLVDSRERPVNGERMIVLESRIRGPGNFLAQLCG